jgi:enoyl-[acyl-carrier-protein] reductase (NADH)
VFAPNAKNLGLTVDEWLAAGAAATLTQRLPTLAQVADTAVFIASDRAGAMTGTVINLSCGAVLD